MDMNHLLDDWISPILLGEGFKRKGRKFLRRTVGFQHVVDISKGRGMMQGKFAITLSAHPMIDGFPGLPELPLRSGDHWMTYRLAPEGLDDRWWWVDKLHPSETEEIVRLLTRQQGEWFARMTSLEAFSEDWYRQVFQIEFAAKRLGLTSARLAYLQATIFASLGQTGTAIKVADTAGTLAGPNASIFIVWVEQLKQRLRDA